MSRNFLPLSFKVVGFKATCTGLISKFEDASELVCTAVFVFQREHANDGLSEAQIEKGTVNVKRHTRYVLHHREVKATSGFEFVIVCSEHTAQRHTR